MLETIIVVLIVLWLLGYVGPITIPRMRMRKRGNAIHILLVIILVLIIVRLLL